MIKNLMGKFVKEQEGGIAEYVIVLGIIALIAIFLGPKLKESFGNFSDCMDASSKKALSTADTTAAATNACA